MKKKEVYGLIYNHAKENDFLYEKMTTEDAIQLSAYGWFETIAFEDDFMILEAYSDDGFRIHCDDITEIRLESYSHDDEHRTMYLEIRFGKDGRSSETYEFERRNS